MTLHKITEFYTKLSILRSSENKISWSYIDWCKICIHFTSLGFRHVGIVAATALKVMALS
jgi:hypothetical protein